MVAEYAVVVLQLTRINERGFKTQAHIYSILGQDNLLRMVRIKDDTALQTQDLKFDLWLSEAELATSRSRGLPTILNLYE